METCKPIRDAAGWLETYQKERVIFVRPEERWEDPTLPHFMLASGYHSSGYINSRLLGGNPHILDQACHDLLCKEEFQGFLELIRKEKLRAVGPAMGAITLADGIGRNITQMFGLDCRTSFAEKRFDEKEGEIMAFDTTPVFPREMLILCEDVTTTGGSVIKTVRAGKKEGAKIARFILALVNRSDATEIEGYKVISLLKKRDLPVMPKWSPADGCPLCEAGSKILRGSPKSRDNWAQLTGQA